MAATGRQYYDGECQWVRLDVLVSNWLYSDMLTVGTYR